MNPISPKYPHTLFILLFVFVCFHGMAFSEEQNLKYEAILIGSSTNEYSFNARAVNDKSEVAVQIDYYNPHLSQAYIWKEGTLTLLPSDGVSAECYDINNNSFVAGRIEYSNPDNPRGAVIWNSNRTPMFLNVPNGYPDDDLGRAYGINNANIAVGSITDKDYAYERAFVYTGSMAVMGVPGGFDPSETNVIYSSINDAGVAVGVVMGNNTSYAIRGLQTMPGAGYTASDINNSGKIVGHSVWYPSNAVIWTNNVPYVYDETPSYAFALNDSGLVVGSVGGSAVIFNDSSYVDLNTLIPQNPRIALVRALDINNNGEILAMGQRSSIVDFYLLRPLSTITYPSLHDLMVAGQSDTIRWIGGEEGQFIDLKYTVDDGTTYRPINTSPVDAGEGKYGWEVPDSLLYREVTIKMTEYDTGDSLTVSEVFRIKPYVITRVGDDGEYEVYEFDTHRWGFENNENEVWPGTWWPRFDYQNGIDRFTNLPYSFNPLYLQFATAQSSDFPDWESFVNAFTVAACYDNPALGYYSLSALNRWESVRSVWGGSCFGMANADAVAFFDQDAFRTKYPGYPNYVNPVNVVAGPSVIPVISELFTYQFGNPFKAYDIERRANSYPTETVEQLKQLFSQDNVPVSGLALYNNHGRGGHEVLPYRLEQDKNEPEYYYIYLWDNSYSAYEDAIIAVNTVSNGNNGIWDAAFGFIAEKNWGGDKYLYVDRPASEFLSNPTLAKPASPQEVFAVPSGRMEITTSVTASTLITDTVGNSIGSDIPNDIPDAYPLTIRNGSETSPYGYQLPAGDYTVVLSDFTEDSAKLFFFTEEGTFNYNRSDVVPGQTDRVEFHGGMSVLNTDTESKAVNLAYTSNGPDGETLVAIQSLILSPEDSVHVEPDTDDRLILKSFGDATSYNVVVGSVSEDGIEVFEHVSVPLPSNTSHTLVPDWTDDAGDQLKILIDSGNDGSIDDSLSVENQTAVEEQTAQAAPAGFRLNGNYPNPFNPTTTISYELPSQSPVIITIYTATGQLIQSYDIGMQSAGMQEFLFDGSGLPSGVYLYRIETGATMRTGRMLLMK